MVAEKWVIDPKLKEWASPRQAEIIDAINKHGGQRAAARALGLANGTISGLIENARKNAARGGYAPGHWSDGVAPGYRMGKVTVQRSAAGVERVWERQHPDDIQRQQGIDEFVDWLRSNPEFIGPVVPSPAATDDDMLAVYAIGDPHFGMRAWAREAGEGFNLDAAKRLTCGAIDRLAEAAPKSSTALLLNVGDMFHANDGTNKTPGHGHPLDVDGRFQEIVEVARNAMVHAIVRLLERHKTVRAWFIPGNHDPSAQPMLALILAAWFRNEPRVIIDTSPSPYRYIQFGRNLIASTHGDGPKPIDLPGIMAHDMPKAWAETEFRVWFTGHIHHLQRQEFRGVTWESLRSLAPADAWHRKKGYSAGREMQCIVFHAQLGEIERHRCDVAMIERAEKIGAGRLGIR